MKKLAALIFSILFLLLIARLNTAYSEPQTVIVVHLSGRVDYGMVYVVKKGVSKVEENKAQLMIIEIDSYGGYLAAADEIIEELSSCNCRVIAWIPPGAKAVSAGALIALAAEKIYMGPGAVFGACQPIPPSDKVVKYVEARVRSLAKTANQTVKSELEKMVSENRAFMTEELVSIGVVEEASSLLDILNREGGYSRIIAVEPDLFSELASLLFDPGVALVMLVIGILLILLEIKATGMQGWGILGGTMVLLAFYVFNIIGPNLLAFTLVIAGIALVILELKKPGIQVFGILGIICLTLSVFIQYAQRPYVNIIEYAPPLAFFLLAVSTFIVITIQKASKALSMKKPTLEERLVGKVGIAKTPISPTKPGVVYVEGETWTAYSSEEIREGEKVVVEKVSGLTLYVKKT